MPKRIVAICLIGVTLGYGLVRPPVLAAAALPELRQEGDRLWAGAGYLTERDGIKLVHLKGTPQEIGMQHALLLGKEAERLRPYVDPSLQPRRGFDALAWKFRDFYMAAKLKPTFMRNIPPEYLEEMRGFVTAISGGKDTDLTPLLVSNAFQELSLVMCTSIAAWGPATTDGRLLHARNLDNSLPLPMVESAFVAIIEPTGRWPFITLTYPASMGVMHAMNAQGITVSMNYSTSSDTMLDGVPHTFLLRQIVEQAATLEQAIELVRTAPRTIGLNIMIGDAKVPRAVVIEVSANHFAVREVDTGFLAATNRYASEEMQPYQKAGWYASALRDQRLVELAEEYAGQVTPAAMAGFLRDKFAPDSAAHAKLLRGIENANTMASVLMDPARQVMWVGVQDEHAPAPERPLLAFSLADALAGADPRRADLDLSLSAGDTAYQADWLSLYQAERRVSQGRYGEALAELQPLAEKYPQSEYVLLLLAWAHMRLGHDEEAIQHFRRITELPVITEPRRLQEAMVRLGVLSDKLGRREEALAWYRRALEVDVTDLGGESEANRQLARTGLRKPLGRPESLLSAWWSAEVFGIPGSAAEEPSGEVVAITILGAHTTDTGWIAPWLGVREGDRVDQARLQAMRRALTDLNAFEEVTVATVPAGGPDQVHLIIRLKEGFGFYKEPVELAVTSAVDMAVDHALSWRYDNIGGRAVNVGGKVGWGAARQRELFLEGPVALAGPNHLRLSGGKRTATTAVSVGELRGTKVTDAQQIWRLGLTRVLDETWTLSLSGTHVSHELRSAVTPAGYQLDAGDYMLYQAQLSRAAGTQARATVFTLTAGGLQGSGHGSILPRATLVFDYKAPVSANMQVAAGVAVGAMDRRTPLLEQFRLGGTKTLRGYSNNVLTTGYAHASIELRRYVRPDMHGGVFVDTAVIADADRQPLTLWSPGVVLRYRTPVGQSLVLSAAWAPPRAGWRVNFGFGTSW